MKTVNMSGFFVARIFSRAGLPAAMLVVFSAIFFGASAAWAVQYNVMDPNYTQEIFTTPLTPGGEAGMAWTASGNLLTRAGSTIFEYSFTQNASHQGTNVHGAIASHPISGLSTSGYGMTKGFDGKIYTPTASGLERFDPSNWASPAQSLAGTIGGAGYGITTLSDGRIAYSDGSGSSSVYIYDPVNLTNTWIYTSPYLIDDIKSGPGGLIALAEQSNSSISIINSLGAVVSSFNTAHYPDGMAFGDGVTSNSIFSNNNDGTITKYTFPSPGYTGVPTQLVIADQTLPSGRAYGDLAAVGPDCAFYVTQYPNNFHGSTPNVGTHWDNGVTNSEASIVRIALAAGKDGLPVCGFYSPLEDVPEPGTVALLLAGLSTCLARMGWKRVVRSRSR
jgi:hypothetical protein